MGVIALAAAVLAAVLVPAPASAAPGWLPHPADATWTYEWSDSAHSATPTKERITVQEQQSKSFTLEWTTLGLGNPVTATPGAGRMGFQETTAGVVNTNWQSSPPPASFPVLCESAIACANSLAGTLYNVIWGSRVPVVAEPLHRGSTWSSRGGADGAVTSRSQYLGRESIAVPAFDAPVSAAKVRTEIVQTGALGDPYGSGVRFVWWVYGVGPVKVVFEHAGGADAALTTSALVSTNQAPVMPPSDANYFPLAAGARMRYRWTNTKHMPKASVQDVVVGAAANNTARFDVRHVSGPIRVTGSYGFSLRTDGLANSWASSRVSSLARFPALGPRFVPKTRRRHFFTPFDLLTYGLNPILPAYPSTGQRWSGRVPSRDYSVYGVKGSTTIVGMRRVKVPAGTFTALAVRSTLRQAGFPFGTGTRTAYFAPDTGLVKLVFRHGDASVSTVELVRSLNRPRV